MEPLEPKPLEELPVDKPKMKLRDTVKPKNRKVDKGGVVAVVGSTVFAAIGVIAESGPEVIEALQAIGVAPKYVTIGSTVVAACGYLYAAITRQLD